MNAQQLTDFVLGELDDNARREVEAAIESDPAVRAEVEEIRSVVTQIEAAMLAEPLPNATAKTPPTTRRWYRISLVEGLVAVSVCGMLLALLMPAQISTQHHRAQRVPQSELIETDATSESPLVAALATTISEDTSLALVDSLSVPETITGTAVVTTAGVTSEREQVSESLTKKLTDEPLENLTERRRNLRTEAVADMASGPAAPSSSATRSRTPAASAPALYYESMSAAAGSGGAYGARGGAMEQQEQFQTLNRSWGSAEKSEAKDGYSDETLSRYLIRRENRAEPESERTPRDPYNSANDEAYQKFAENEFLKPSAAPFSTFSIDVDTAAYSTMRRFVKDGGRPPKDAVRLEEYINYFKYSYPQPKGDAPFAVVADVVRCPWESQHLLARVALQGKIIDDDARPAVNLVFLIDVSGSMSASNRLPLVKRSLTELVERLQGRDRVAIVTYAGSTQVVLPSVSGNEKRAILDSIESLTSGGSTAGASGIKLAYETARKYYTKDGQNRVILCTDGDFNVGTTDNKTLEDMIGDEAKSGVFLTILGFGMGNYKDERLSVLSQRGNGNYGYIDSLDEAQKLLVEGLTGTLVTIAKDVKIQIDFNPKRVAAYRLLGYENRKLRDEDFHNDAKDAGEIGAGHSVTALYEIVPVGVRVPQGVDASRYAEKPAGTSAPEEATTTDAAHSEELLLVKLRYKEPEESKSKLIETPLIFTAGEEKEATGDCAFAAGVALFGMLLRDSQYVGSGKFSIVRELTEPNTSDDKYRQEFLELVKKVAN